MTRKNILAGLVVTVALSLFMTACKDTKTLQANEQLKAQVTELQKENGELGNKLETVTADRDALLKQNQALRVKKKPRKARRTRKKVARRRRR
ncbi:MAG TPA: hypothetical protein VNI36_02395 [Candidatus Dormibacteraeota bacterium]|nr:hypothetical protein [Candidatus Dormibacteraeota bacterium]